MLVTIKDFLTTDLHGLTLIKKTCHKDTKTLRSHVVFLISRKDYEPFINSARGLVLHHGGREEEQEIISHRSYFAKATKDKFSQMNTDCEETKKKPNEEHIVL